MYRKLLILLVVFLFPAITSCDASQSGVEKSDSSSNNFLTDNQAELVRTVLRVDSNLTQEMHTAFWADRHKVDMEKSISAIKKTMPIGNRYQRELWDSARLSKLSSKVIRTKELDAAWEEYEPLLAGSSNKAKDYASSFLEAAASGNPVIREGEEVYITDNLINQVISGLDESFERLNNLTDPNWKARK